MPPKVEIGICLVVDDHPLFGEALAIGVARIDPDCEVLHAASFGQAQRILERQPNIDLVLLDLMLPDVLGLRALSTFRAELPLAKLIMVSGREEDAVIRTAMACGADGFIGKSQPLEQLIAQLERVLLGEHVFPATGRSDRTDRSSQVTAGLSPAQLRILVALADGRLNKQIAHDLDLAEATVKSHLSAIFRKLGVNNRSQAILMARELIATD
ncbi:response regulator transcription factor [Henriciella sp.]|uniref:response regulator n=1 Tax=Henriciella sp. TaxID=1968823 RepID=UPI0026355FE2|nr:response regulator transcription factor [Henriciella sp.]